MPLVHAEPRAKLSVENQSIVHLLPFSRAFDRSDECAVRVSILSKPAPSWASPPKKIQSFSLRRWSNAKLSKKTAGAAHIKVVLKRIQIRSRTAQTPTASRFIVSRIKDITVYKRLRTNAAPIARPSAYAAFRPVMLILEGPGFSVSRRSRITRHSSLVTCPSSLSSESFLKPNYSNRY